MNFFGHAVISSILGDGSHFVFGSMLPDFAGMAGVRLGVLEEEVLAEGLACHHDSDAAFHGHPRFVAACHMGIERLTSAGVARGPARAVAHVGFELLLDGALSTRTPCVDAYREALSAGRGVGAHVVASGAEDRQRAAAWERIVGLCSRLSHAPVPGGYRSVDFTVDRLQHVLAHRPRLALADTDLQAVRAYCADLQPMVEADAEEIVGDVESTLRAR